MVSMPQISTDRVLFPTADLREGDRLAHAIEDEDGTLLLAAGYPLTEEIKRQFLRREITHVSLHPDDIASMSSGPGGRPSSRGGSSRQGLAPGVRRTLSGEATAQERLATLQKTVAFTIENTGPVARDLLVNRRRECYDLDRAARTHQQFAAGASIMKAVAESILQGAEADGGNLARLANGYMGEIRDDMDQTLSASSAPGQGPPVAQRSVRLSVLSMAIAVERGLDKLNVIEIGMCALLHDLGINVLEERLRDPKEPFNEEDWDKYSRHPLHTFELLDRVANVSHAVRLAATQVHEQINGSGFPRGIRGHLIHPYAKVVNVADAYLSLTSELRGRPALTPYDAMACMLHHVPKGRFDQDTVKALLLLLSQFPVGSAVRLSDGKYAHVLRRDGHYFAQPIIGYCETEEEVQADPSAWRGEPLSLRDTDLRIVAPVIRKNRREMRLERECLDDIIWDGPGS
jgi:HD-GYP domain-containing protein (c-di-GMP phosphodiesterase class II)